MRRAAAALVAAFFGVGCSVTVVYAPKDVILHNALGCDVTITGSDLKGNSASQTAEGSIPFLK